MPRHNRWRQQLLTITDAGFAAFRHGQPESACPYQGGYRNQNGAGGQLQRQRRLAWLEGWRMAARQARENAK